MHGNFIAIRALGLAMHYAAKNCYSGCFADGRNYPKFGPSRLEADQPDADVGRFYSGVE